MSEPQAEYEILDSEELHRGFLRVRRLRLRHRLFAGGWSPVLQRELLERHDAVGVLLYDPWQDRVALVEQFRVGALGRLQHPWLLELVAGLIDQQESPEQVARREAFEEAGVEVDRLEPIASYFSSPGASTEYFHLFAGRCHLPEHGGLFGLAEEGEDIRLVLMSSDEAISRSHDAAANAHSLIALGWLARERHRLQQEWCACAAS